MNWDEFSKQAATNRVARAQDKPASVQSSPSLLAVHRNTQTFWAQNPSGLNNLLTEQMKFDLAASGESFFVTRVRMVENTAYGPAWFADILFKNEPFTIAFSPNEQRDSFMVPMRNFISANGPIACILEQFQTKQGQTGWNLAPPVQDEQPSPPVDSENVPY
jgi:hypothetical protein